MKQVSFNTPAVTQKIRAHDVMVWGYQELDRASS
jgi:hypothetical protein